MGIVMAHKGSTEALKHRIMPQADICMALQVWVKPEVRDGKVYWLADSDSALTKVVSHTMHVLLCLPAILTKMQSTADRALYETLKCIADL